LNELYGGERPDKYNEAELDDNTEQRDNNRLSKAYGEVKVLQRQKHTLYGLQDANDRIEVMLKKSDSELGKMKNRATQRSKVNAKTMATQLEIVQRSENVMGQQVHTLTAKIKHPEKDIVQHET